MYRVARTPDRCPERSPNRTGTTSIGAGADDARARRRTRLHENALRRTVALLVQRGIVTPSQNGVHRAGDRRSDTATLAVPGGTVPALPFPTAPSRSTRPPRRSRTPTTSVEPTDFSQQANHPPLQARAVTRSLASLGFAPSSADQPEAGAVVLALSRCPFSDAVTSSAAGRRVCDFHHGSLAGIAEAHGGEVSSFTVNDPRGAACEVAVQGGVPLTASGP